MAEKNMRVIKLMKIASIVALFMLSDTVLMGQNLVDTLQYQGNRTYRATNVHDGNRIRTNFFNYGLIGRNVDEEFGGEWPKNEGQEAVGDVSMNVGAEVRVDVDTSRVAEILASRGITPDDPDYEAKLDSAVTSYSIQAIVTVSDGPRTQNEYDPNGETFWGWEPLPGFMTPDSNIVAMSHQEFTWPESWPDKQDQGGWRSSWNGYFGRDQFNADQESYWRMDDYTDREFINDIYQYYPNPNSDRSRGGLGIQAGARGFQWSNAQAQDAIFWVYDITNISEKNLDKTGFSILMGGIIGLNSGNDNAKFYRAEVDRNGEKLNMAVSYDNIQDGWDDFVWVGYKFLESPGNFTDGIDNDADSPNADSYDKIDSLSSMFDPISYNAGDKIVLIGDIVSQDTLIDIGNGPESVWYVRYNDTFTRDTVALPNKPIVIYSNSLNPLNVIRPGDFLIEETALAPDHPNYELPDLYDDNLNGLIDESPTAHHGFAYKNYFTGLGVDDIMIDESRSDGIDNDNDWNINTDDVGADGQPGTGDFGEGDGVPTNGEPNFDILDIDEADQIGLTAFYFFQPFNRLVQRNDQGMWDAMRPGFFNSTEQDVDGDFIFSSSYFPLLSGQTERISLVLLYANNEEGLINKAATVQQIYNFNYSFAQAPTVPFADGSPYNQRVVIYWDNTAEDSFDRLFGRAVPGNTEPGFDFEGYRIYRSTSPTFTPDITNAFGEAQFIRPIAIFDIANEVSGLSENDIEGVRFNLGDDSGLANSYEDVGLINGLEYYYVVNSFDHGYVSELYAQYPELDQFSDIAPSESPFSIKLLPSGEVVTGPNVIAITPDNPAVGYVPPTGADNISHDRGPGTGPVTVNLLDPFALDADSALYRITFADSIIQTHTYYNDAREIVGFDTTFGAFAYNVEKILPNNVGDFITTPDTVYNEWPLDKNRAIVDGIEFVLDNEEDIRYNSSRSGMMDSNGQFYSEQSDKIRASVTLFKAVQGAFEGPAFAYDYVIEQYDTFVDTSIAVDKVVQGEPLRYSAIPVKFRVLNATENRYVDFLFQERSEFVIIDGQFVEISYKDSLFSYNDKLIILEGPQDGQVSVGDRWLKGEIDLGWNITTSKDTLLTAPAAGEFFYLSFNKPYSHKDQFSSVIGKAEYDPIVAQQMGLDQVKAVPNPYIATSRFEKNNPNTDGRGERAIRFTHLPPKCTIRIYTVTGELVDVIYHEAGLFEDSAQWDVKTKDNLDVAYGVYLFHVEAPDLGSKIGKFAIIK
jgi:hypothetical protein